MPIVTVLVGALLIGVGVWGKVSTNTASVTALIPAFFGIPLVLLGLLALKERFLKHAMHAAAMIGLLGFVAGVANLIRTWVKNGSFLSFEKGTGWTVPISVWSTAALTGLCLVFVLLCVNSFIQARRRRRAREAAAANQPLPTP